MRSPLAALLIATLCAGCGDRRETPAKAYVHWKDRIVVAAHIPIFGLRPPCTTRWIGDKNVGGWERLPVDKCIKFDAPQRMRGLWRNEFEGSEFCVEPAQKCSDIDANKRSRPLVWLDFAKPGPDSPRPRQYGGLYTVDFIGRRTAYRGAYGQMGGFDEMVLVDRMISMKQIEAPPPRPEDETLK